jgi:hypothetical protein
MDGGRYRSARHSHVSQLRLATCAGVNPRGIGTGAFRLYIRKKVERLAPPPAPQCNDVPSISGNPDPETALAIDAHDPKLLSWSVMAKRTDNGEEML